VTLQNCTSSECDGLLTPVAEVAARIRALKGAPASEVLVAAITGPVTPYTIEWQAPSTTDTSCGMASCPWPLISRSCTATDGSFADPAVRVTQLAAAFGANGFVSSICDADFAPALQQIATRIGTLLADGGGTGGPAGRIPICAVTGLGGGTGTGSGGGGAGGGSGGGAPGSDAAAGTGVSSGSGCGCQAGGAAAGISGFGAAGAIIAGLAARRRRRRRA
jgi:MYXO-CTERM domain-containing protein